MKSYTYDAFISYRHVKHDKAIAQKLQKLLEMYSPPKNGSYSNTNKIKKVFRDESELPTSGDLALDIKKALEQSAFLIVICSEETAKSQWCLQEISYFKELHNGNNERILTLLVSGDPREVFPKELCYENRLVKLSDGSEKMQVIEVEPLAANVTAKTTKASIKKLKLEFLRIAAPILGCGYDDLYKRHQKRLVRNVIFTSATIVAILLSFSGFSYAQFLRINNQASQIFSQKTEIESAYGKLEKTNQQLSDINGDLEESNNKLSTQIKETSRQKNIAEANGLEAQNQAKLAKENEKKALSNLELANEQKALANEQKALAMENQKQAENNLSYAQEQQLFRTINYAKQLSDTGDKVQAASILNEAYDRFAKGSGDYTDFKDQIEVAMANTAYYPGYSAYYQFQEEGKVEVAAFSEEDTIFAVATGNDVTVRNTSNGEVCGSYKHKAKVTALYIKSHYLITGTEGASLYVWNLEDGRLLMEAPLDYYHSTGNKVNKIACNDRINSIELLNTAYMSVTFIAYPWLAPDEGSPEIQQINAGRDFTMSDNGKYLIYSNPYTIKVLNLDKFNFKLSKEKNLINMTIRDIIVPRLYGYSDQPYGINDEGIVYYKTEVQDATAKLGCRYYANLYDAQKGSLIKKFEVTIFDRVVLKNNLGNNVIMIRYDTMASLNLEYTNPVANAKTLITNYHIDNNLKMYYIPNSDDFLLWNEIYRDGCWVYNLMGTQLKKLQKSNAPLSLITASHDSDTILTASVDGNVLIHKRNNNYRYIKYIGKNTEKNNTYIGSGIQYISDSENILASGSAGNPKDFSMVYDVIAKRILSKLSFSTSDYSYFECLGGNTDDKLLFGFESPTLTGEPSIRIWNTHTGKIVNSLNLLNAKMKESSLNSFGISPDFKFIAVCFNKAIYVYSVENNIMISTYQIDDHVDYIGVENDGHTVWMINSTESNIKVIDLKEHKVILNKVVDISGNSISEASLNLKDNRVTLHTYQSYEDDIKSDISVYSLSTGKRLISLSEILDRTWLTALSRNTYKAYGDDSAGRNCIVTIPTFDVVLKDIREMGRGRILTAKERQLSGLNIFDNKN
jgi:hypothetical protein